jgi:hypothetical protein
MFGRPVLALMVAIVAAAALAVATQAERSLLGGGEDTRSTRSSADITPPSEWRLVERVKLGFDAPPPESAGARRRSLLPVHRRGD